MPAEAVRPGDRVAVLDPDPSRQLELAEAVLGAGAEVAVLDHAWPTARRSAALTDIVPTLLVLDGALRRLEAPGPAVGAGWITLTSGSAGRPKVLLRRLTSWTDSFPAFTALTGIQADDVILVPGGLSSSLCGFAALHGRAVGARLVLPARWGRPALDAGCTVAHLVPSMLADLVDASAPGFSPRVLICAGDTLDPALAARALRRWPDVALVEYYGSSEQSFVTLRDHGPAGDVGRPFPGVVVEIRDDAGQVLPDAVDGTIWTRSPYAADAELRAGVPGPLGRAGWVSVGDRGVLDAGRLRLLGRTRLVTGGVVVEPAAVEAALRAAGAAEAVVFGLPHPRLGEVVCAAVAGGPGRAVLVRRLRADLAAAQRPRRWFAADPLPRLPGGKPDRVTLTAAAAAGRLPRL